MSVTRISKYCAQTGKSDELRAFLLSIVPDILSSAGCQSAKLLQSQDNPARFVIIEAWDSIEAHQDSVKSIAPEAIMTVTALLAGPPDGEYFHS